MQRARRAFALLVAGMWGCSAFAAVGMAPPSGSAEAGAMDGGADTASGLASDAMVEDANSLTEAYGAPVVVLTEAPGLFGLALDAQYIYMTNSPKGAILRAARWAPGAAADAGLDVLTSGALSGGRGPEDLFLSSGRLVAYLTGTSLGSACDGGTYTFNIDSTGANPSCGLSFDPAEIVGRLTSDGLRLYMTVAGADYYAGLLARILTTPYAAAGMRPDFLPWSSSSTESGGPIVSDGAQVFFATASSHEIYRMLVDGTDLERFVGGQARKILELAVDSTRLYWADEDGVLRSIDKSAPIPTVDAGTDTRISEIARDQPAVTRLAVGPTRLYFTSSVQGTVKMVPKAGGAVLTLGSNQGVPTSIARADEGVYWVNNATGTLMIAPRRPSP